MDLFEVAVLDELPIADALGDGEQLVRVVAAQHRVEPHAVADQVETVHGVGVATVELQVQRDRQLRPVADLATHRLGHQTMSQIQMMHGREGTGTKAQTGCVLGGAVAQVGGAPRLVQRGVGFDAVAQTVSHDARIVGQFVGGVAVEPTVPIAEVLRQIPVVERDRGLDALVEQRVDHALVVVKALLVDRAVLGRHHTRHGHRQTVGVHAQIGEQIDVLLPQMVGITGHITGIAVHGFAGRVGERVPNRWRAAALGGAAFDLIRGRGRTKLESFGKCHGHIAPLSGHHRCGGLPSTAREYGLYVGLSPCPRYAGLAYLGSLGNSVP
ncbi:Uncharacterised protein [Bifidobacterium longum subsp. infantis]|nr:Uncharacterised protein [Bifidobacterium longum subsp. infantis]